MYDSQGALQSRAGRLEGQRKGISGWMGLEHIVTNPDDQSESLGQPANFLMTVLGFQTPVNSGTIVHKFSHMSALEKKCSLGSFHSPVSPDMTESAPTPLTGVL